MRLFRENKKKNVVSTKSRELQDIIPTWKKMKYIHQKRWNKHESIFNHNNNNYYYYFCYYNCHYLLLCSNQNSRGERSGEVGFNKHKRRLFKK